MEYGKRNSEKLLCDNAHTLTRRKFGKTAMAGIAGMETLLSVKPSFAAEDDYISHMKPNPSRLKLGFGQFPANADDELLTFTRQFGVEWVSVWVGEKDVSVENFTDIINRFGKYGIKCWLIGSEIGKHKDAITLNLPGRDEKIEEFLNYLRICGKVGLHNFTLGYSADGVWSTGSEPIRGGVGGKSFDLEKAKKVGAASGFGKPLFPDKLIHGRLYTEKEIWDNWEYYMRKVVPVAEENEVRIGFHPDDPPLPILGGVPRICTSFEGYKRAIEIADSPYVGLCLCVGCWLAGGDAKGMGKGVVDVIHYFGKQNKIFKVHFRNVERPLPHSRETFLDDGYMDMYKVMKALREENNDCMIIDDHIPPGTVGGWKVGRAFNIGYMRALLERANEEVGGQG
jgi:mannonate dehydratase